MSFSQGVLRIFSVPIVDIKEVRGGKTTEALKNKEIAGIYQDECAFSIIFGEDFESMDLIANTPDEANIWLTGLTCLINASTKTRTCEYTIVSFLAAHGVGANIWLTGLTCLINASTKTRTCEYTIVSFLAAHGVGAP